MTVSLSCLQSTSPLHLTLASHLSTIHCHEIETITKLRIMTPISVRSGCCLVSAVSYPDRLVDLRAAAKLFYFWRLLAA